MYNIKGFYSYAALINNNSDVVAKFGELSSNSATYAKDKTIHTGASTPNTTFVSFHSVKDETVVDITPVYKTQILNIGEFIYREALAGTIRDRPEVLRQMINAEFGTVISDFTTGLMLTDGTIWMPEWIEFKIPGAPDINQINIWLADASFASQYDEYVIEIIHPITPYDDFFKDPLLVKQRLDEYNLVEKLEEVQAKRAEYPYTFQRAFMFEYHNPRDNTMRFPAHWIALIYGQAGNNPDVIKEAIVKELLANSVHPRPDWEAIIPDLFMTTEFIITPFWDQYSVPNADYRAGFYSPVIDPRARLNLIRRTARGPGYTQAYVDSKYELASNMYKSLAFAVVGNPQNRNGVTQFSMKFPDYMLVTTDSPDFNRVDPVTQEWMMLVGKLLKTAETMDRYSSVPIGISRMIRDNVIYATAFYKNVNYLVVSRDSVENLL